MLTSIKDYIQLLESKNSKEKGLDLIVVDVQEDYKKYFGDQYLEELKKYCEKFTRVFQIYDINKTKDSSYVFPNQVKKYSKKYGGSLDIDLVDQLFHKSQTEYIKSRLKNIPNESEFFETIYNEYWIYIGAQHNEDFKGHEWFFCNKELVDLFRTLKKQNRKCILVGGAGGECLLDIYKTMKVFQIDVEYNNDFVFNKKGSKFQIYDNKDK